MSALLSQSIPLSPSSAVPTSPLLTLACLPGSSQPLPEPPRFPVHRPLWPRRGPWLQLSLYGPLPSACPLTQRLTRAIRRHGGGAAWNCLSGWGPGRAAPGPVRFRSASAPAFGIPTPLSSSVTFPVSRILPSTAPTPKSQPRSVLSLVL